MTTNVRLSKEEVKEAIALYLEQKGLDVDEDNVEFKIRRKGGQRGMKGTPRLHQAKCSNVQQKDD